MNLKRPSFHRPVWAEISHKNLRHNFREISKVLPKKTAILAVVKANAYGHGIVPVSRTLVKAGARFLGITSIEESIELKKAGVRTPALILGNIYPFENLVTAIKNGTHVTIASAESARVCALYAKKLKKKVFAHAKIDTGMNRVGVASPNAVDFIKKILSYPEIRLEGIYTHFSGSAEDPEFTTKQLSIFEGILKKLDTENIRIPFAHCANSGAILRYPESHMPLVRAGISLYGVNPCRGSDRIHLKPVLSWKSRIVFLKTVPEGTPVSYAGTFRTKRPSKIATIAVGYADGFRRSLSNKASVLVNGKRAPVVGRVTMDMTMIDVTDVPGVKVGDEAVLIGSQGDAAISAGEFAAWNGTISYEVFCGIGTRVPRVEAD